MTPPDAPRGPTRAMTKADIAAVLHIVSDGERAMEFLQRCGRYSDAPRPDLILLDAACLPADGPDLLERIKSDPAFQAIPVIVVGDSNSSRELQRAYARYANCRIVKPLSPERLDEVVRVVAEFWLQVATLPPRVMD